MAPLSPDLAATLSTITAGAIFAQLVPPAHQGRPLEETRARYAMAAGGALALGLGAMALSGGARAPVVVALATAAGLMLVHELAGRLEPRAVDVADQGAVAVHGWG